MNQHGTYLTKTIFMATCLTLGCTSSGALGCGSSSGGGGPQVDSDLLGIYQVDRYQSSPECDELMDAPGAPSRLALYSVPSNDNPQKALLVGQFCGDVANCRERVKDFPGAVNYSFFQGSDQQGWQGWGIASQGNANDQCQADVQSHRLASPNDGSVTIDTTTYETVFPPTETEGNEVTCSILAAIEAIDDESPCKGLFLLEATFEAGL